VKHASSFPIELLYPDPYLTPIIHMSPFSGKLDSVIPACALDEHELLKEISNELLGKELYGLVTVNGREAIALALENIVTGPEFLISIITPSNSGYVSSCVTNEINKRCSYAYGYSEKVDAYFLIHEFGQRLQPPQAVIDSGKPIIEDCAYALVHPSLGGTYGSIGDYIIYSLPKAFEMQYGGLLFSKDVRIQNAPRKTSPNPYVIGKLHHYFLDLRILNAQRFEVYRRMQAMARAYGCKEAWEYNGAGLPHAFMVQMPKEIDVNKIKTHMNKYGIESSVFYGGGAYFLPCHQNLNEWEIEYMFCHISNALRTFGEVS
jgi:hypothetical protein